MLISLDNVAMQVWKNRSYGNYTRGSHFLERLCLQYCSKIQLQISFFKRVKTAGQNSLHIYSLSPDESFLAKFPQYLRWLFSILWNGLFFKNKQSKEQEHDDHHSVI